MSIIKKHFESLTDEQVFLEFVNDWLTIDRMAEFYDADKKELEKKINNGRVINNSK